MKKPNLNYFLYKINRQQQKSNPKTSPLIILELVRHTDAMAATNGHQTYAETNGNNNSRPDEGGGVGGILSLICGALCKDTPLAEMFATPAAGDNLNNNNNATPLMAPIQNGEDNDG